MYTGLLVSADVALLALVVVIVSISSTVSITMFLFFTAVQNTYIHNHGQNTSQNTQQQTKVHNNRQK